MSPDTGAATGMTHTFTELSWAPERQEVVNGRVATSLWTPTGTSANWRRGQREERGRGRGENEEREGKEIEDGMRKERRRNIGKWEKKRRKKEKRKEGKSNSEINNKPKKRKMNKNWHCFIITECIRLGVQSKEKWSTNILSTVRITTRFTFKWEKNNDKFIDLVYLHWMLFE